MTQIDVWGATLIDTTSGTSHTPNPATPTSGNIDCAIVLISAVAAANGTTPITFTAPTNWTLVQTSSEPGGAGSLSTATAIAFRDNRASTVTPPAFTTNVATIANIYHVLASPVAGALFIDAPGDATAPVGAIVEVYTPPVHTGTDAFLISDVAVRASRVTSDSISISSSATRTGARIRSAHDTVSTVTDVASDNVVVVSFGESVKGYKLASVSTKGLSMSFAGWPNNQQATLDVVAAIALSAYPGGVFFVCDNALKQTLDESPDVVRVF